MNPHQTPDQDQNRPATLWRALRRALKQRPSQGADATGEVTFVGAGPGAADLLTLRALAAIQAADVILHDRLIGRDVLALASARTRLLDVGKTGFGPSTPQTTIDTLIVQHARSGARVVRLKAGDSTVFGRLDEEIEACEAAGLHWSIIPGITAASAAVATIGQSLTRRGRNSSVRFLTGHDIKGFADHDWATLCAPGEVAAIYMGKSSARFIQGRLLMHGARTDTPVSLVENASRNDERIVATTLTDLPASLDDHDLSGPVLMLLGLSPRQAHTTLTDLPQHQLQKELA